MAIAEALRSRPAPTLQPGECGLEGCDGVLVVDDYTGDNGHIAGDLQPARTYELPVTTWLPGADEPVPAIVYAHGLGGSRRSAESSASVITAEGFAVVAIDAPGHGDHPDGTGGTAGLEQMLALFGVNLDAKVVFDPFTARDNLRQSTFDTLQLLEALRSGEFDADGDGSPDIDPDALHYVGNSLGGVNAASVLALAPDIRTATLVVAGARITELLRASASFGGFVGAVAPSATPSELRKLLALAQAVFDAGEPAVFAEHVLADRFPSFEGIPPQVLLPMAVGDDVVPNTATADLGLALGLPIVGEEHVVFPGIDSGFSLPIRENLGPGLTAGIHQCEGSSHGLITDPAAFEQMLHFLRSYDPPIGSEIR